MLKRKIHTFPRVTFLSYKFTNLTENRKTQSELDSRTHESNLEQFEADLLSGMAERGYTTEFASSIVGQIRGFAAYGFPDSHASSFALLAYASSWLKCHEPATFLAALLNSQPMGFYSRSALVRDAQRHGVEVRPVDVCISNWKATLEPPTEGSQPAVRLGLNNVKSLEQEAAWRIEEARAIDAFGGTSDMAVRANLDGGDMTRWLVQMPWNRCRAIGAKPCGKQGPVSPDKGLLRPAEIVEDLVELESLTEAENVAADYLYVGLTLGRHPLSFLRERLSKMRFIPSDGLAGFSNGQLARGCGIVTVLQRPSTAKGGASSSPLRTRPEL